MANNKDKKDGTPPETVTVRVLKKIETEGCIISPKHPTPIRMDAARAETLEKTGFVTIVGA